MESADGSRRLDQRQDMAGASLSCAGSPSRSRASADLSAGARSVEELIDGLEQGAAIPDLDPSSPNEEPHLIDKNSPYEGRTGPSLRRLLARGFCPPRSMKLPPTKTTSASVSRHKLADTIEDRDTPGAP